ncbi:MAG: hypothetical protein LUF35_10315 [Lachnospiraceae bacterium]|nr:hypothetical protein [Lachnospiraceae bacterium]
MIKYKASERRVDIYDIGDGLSLMNIILKNCDGEMMAIDTYIGIEGNGFSCVGHTEGLDQPGVIFSYAGYVRRIKANISIYRDIFYTNINGG